MRYFISFDDTDNIGADRGTGKLARWFENELPEGARVWGVVRQQLLVDERVPYTSHNSAACVVVDHPDSGLLDELIERGISHISSLSLDGSDPGLCAVRADSPRLPGLIEFGISCTNQVRSQKEALKAAEGVHLSGHGGTNDGVIGAAAAVGLTASGWSGRFIEFGRLRKLDNELKVSDLAEAGIMTLSIERDTELPGPDDTVDTRGWLRPRLWGGRPVLIARKAGPERWESIGEKRKKAHA